jgi:hypothetical protein
MTQPRDPDAIIATWLDDGPIDLPEETRRAIVVGLRTQPRARPMAILGGLPVNPLTRFVAAAAIVLAVGGLSIFVLSNRSGGPGTAPSQTSTSSITLTDSGCTWNGNPGSMAIPSLLNLRFRNETDHHGLFILHWVKPGHSWQEGVDFVAELQRLLATGSDWPPNDVSIAVAEHEVAARGATTTQWATSGVGDGPTEEFRDGGSWHWAPGTYGVVCSANTSPTGDILTTFLVGPLQLTPGLPSPSPSPSQAP